MDNLIVAFGEFNRHYKELAYRFLRLWYPQEIPNDSNYQELTNVIKKLLLQNERNQPF